MPRKPRPKSGRRSKGTGSIFFSAARGEWVGRAIVGRLPSGRPRYAQVTGASEAEVVERLRGVRPPGPKTTVAEWCRRWLAQMSCRPRTRRGREDAVRLYVAPTLGAVRLAALAPGQIDAAARQWSAALGPGTVRTLLSILGTCLQAAVRAGLRPDNPARLATRPRGPKTRVEPYTPKELARVVAAADDYPPGRIVALLAATGLRVGEACALDAADFDPEKGTVSVTRSRPQARTAPMGPPKSPNSVRTVRVPAAALPALAAARGGRDSGPLFVTRAGTRANHGTTRAAWVLVCRRLGVPRRNLHQLRHSVATAMVAAGVPLPDAAAYLGDSVSTLIRTYLHATGADPAAVMNGLLSGTPDGQTITNEVTGGVTGGAGKGGIVKKSRRKRG